MPDSPLWEDIRRAYETSPETVAEIAIRFGVRAKDVSARANVSGSGWQLRERGTAALAIANAKRAAKSLEATLPAGITADPEPATSAQLKATNGGGTLTHRKAIIKRLYNVLDAKLTEVEARIALQKKLTGPDTERESRQLANLIKTFEKLTELSDAPAKTTKPNAAITDQGQDDAERLRQDLLERFARLQQQPTAASSAA
jgi:hypothetical protein